MEDKTQTRPDEVQSPGRRSIFAVIVTYNIGQKIHRCFDSVESQVGHVVIVDNGSDESTRAELNKLANSGAVTLILNERNEGTAHAYNQAVRWAKNKPFEWILLLDHDSEATPGMVERLSETFADLRNQGIHNVGMVAPNAFDVNLQSYPLYGPPVEDAPVIEDEDAPSSGSLAFLQAFDIAGPFSEDLYLYYVNTEFCRRLGRKGFRVFIRLDAILLHREGTKTKHKFLWRYANYDHYRKESRYYLMRNAVYLLKRRILNSSDLRRLIRRYAKDHLKVLLFDRERFSILWFSLRGLIDGLRGKMGPIDRRRRAA